MLKIKKSITFLLMLSTMFSCSIFKEDQAGGTGGSETTNTVAVNGVLVDVDGKAISGAEVTLIPSSEVISDELDSTIYLTTQTNEQGAYDFGNVLMRQYSFFIYQEDSLGHKIQAVGDLDNDTLQINGGLISQTLEVLDVNGEALNNARVQILGTPFAEVANDQGSVEFKLSDGEEYVAKVTLDQREHYEWFIAASSDTLGINIPPSKTWVLTDFTDNCNYNNLNSIFGGSTWPASDGFVGELTPTTAMSDPGSRCTENNTLKVQWKIDTSYTEPNFMILRTLLGPEGEGLNLSKVDSIQLKIKGTGTVRLIMLTQDRIDAGDYQFYTIYEIPLNENWQVETLGTDEFKIQWEDPSEFNLSWDESSVKTTALQILAWEDGLIEIDSITFIGANPDEMNSNF